MKKTTTELIFEYIKENCKYSDGSDHREHTTDEWISQDLDKPMNVVHRITRNLEDAGRIYGDDFFGWTVREHTDKMENA